MLSSITHRLLSRMSFDRTGLYNVSKKLQHPENYLPLYRSKVFTSQVFADIFKSSESALRYKQLLPTLLTSQIGFYPQRYLYTSLGFDPQNETLRIVTLRAAGYHTQVFRLQNILPWSYRDMCAQSKLPEPRHPTFLDDEMIYFNKFAMQTLFCERDGEWNEQTINHPKLDITVCGDEKRWFYRQNIF